MFVMTFVYGISEHPKMIYLIQIEVRKEVILDKCSGLLVLLFHNLLLFVEYLLESVLIVGFSCSAIGSRHGMCKCVYQYYLIFFFGAIYY